jgi:hypothetical protein
MKYKVEFTYQDDKTVSFEIEGHQYQQLIESLNNTSVNFRFGFWINLDHVRYIRINQIEEKPNECKTEDQRSADDVQDGNENPEGEEDSLS